ncbi:peptidoglycan-binding protein [Adhaeribacter arboris]|uniref:Peptidoglycan-binding protein n=1 Tax=Adhaeribacter arboris TaxID=2072846 RepID=A0A2T2YL24_9BACT|nr:LysM peptidoglycan-binding domain-containing protein [Adhaeribacter arboris]PSR56208.1 peptidoglycan-binding protein [Adhaeribacter arboris]
MIKRWAGWMGVMLWLLVSNYISGWAQTTSLPTTNALGKQEKLDLNNIGHQVQPGDTYYRLAKKYQVPVDSLLKWNGQNLTVGKVVRIAAEPSLLNQADTLIQVTPRTSVALPEQAPVPSPEISTEETGKSTTAKSSYRNNRETAETGTEKMMQRVLVVPFDPYLYFSDADEDIARQSKLPKQNIRYIFRSRLNAYLDPNGFEIINLLDGNHLPNSDELKKAYKSLAYSYQDVSASRFHPLPAKQKPFLNGPEAWFRKQKEKAGLVSPEEVSVAAEGEKYYGVKVKSPDFYPYFNERYNLDYYIFINQFEIHTDYTNCLDRTTQNFTREFLVHYTIFDAQGELIAGNKVKIPYVSNVNEINKIVRDNLNKIAQRILADLPQPQVPSSEAAQN